jgi:hypothetical protein
MDSRKSGRLHRALLWVYRALQRSSISGASSIMREIERERERRPHG